MKNQELLFVIPNSLIPEFTQGGGRMRV